MSNIAEQIKVKQNTYEMLQRALERIIQLYTDKSHFVYELLQNAEDSEATQIKFVQYEDRLEVLHDGKPFTETNLAGLCDIGKSDKVDDLNQIGEFGVGFKSVYGICDTVRLYSNPANYHGKKAVKAVKFAVQINGFITPQDISYETMPDKYTTRFVFPYSVGRNYSGFKDLNSLNDTLSQKLSDLGITTLLFMKNLELIEYEIISKKKTESGQYLLEKKIINDHCMLVSALGSTGKKETDQEQLSFLRFSRPIDQINAQTVDIAFPVRIDEEGAYTFEKSSNPFVSVYFPTETESKLDFIVQGPFRTTPNRSSIPSDDKDNMRLAEETAKLLKSSLVELRNKGILNMSLLKIMPIDPTPFFNFPLFKPLNLAVKELLRFHDMLPCRDNQYTKKEFARISRQERLPAIMPDSLLTELIDDGNEYHWLPSVLTETNHEYGHLYRFLIGAEMKVPTIRPEDLRQLINANKSFLPKRPDMWLVELYSIFENIPNVFSKSKNEVNMLTCEFVKTSKGQFVAPYKRTEDKQYIPNVFLPTTKLSSDSILCVDENIYKRCPNFFENILGLKKPDEYRYFVDDFKKRYSGGKSINKQTHIDDVKKLIKYRKIDEYSGEHTDEVTGLIRDYLYLLCDDGVFRRPGAMRIYVPETESGVKIKEYYKTISKNLYFTDQDFYKENGISEADIANFNVKNSLIVSESIVTGIYDTGTKGRVPSWNSEGDFRWKMSLDLLKEALQYIGSHPSDINSIFKSQAILLELLNNDTKIHGDVIIGGSTPNLHGETCEAIKILKGQRSRNWDGRWIFTEPSKLVTPKEISKHDIPSSLYGNKLKLDSELFELLGFKKSEADEVDEIKKQIPQKQLDAYFESELKKRFGLSSADLFERISSGETNTASAASAETYPFPVANVRNWDSLAKHAAEMLCYASPTVYQKVERTIRVSTRDEQSRAYLKGFYRYPGMHSCACQLCHDSTADFESVGIFKKPEFELDPINLSLCPSCATFYRQLRNDAELMRQLKDKIISLSKDEIRNSEPVVIKLEDQEIWFTQIHIAEIHELLILERDVKNVKESLDEPEDNPATPQASNTKASSLNDFVGKKVYRKWDGMVGVIRKIEGEFCTVYVTKGSHEGKTLQIKVSSLISRDGRYKVF